MPDERVYAVEEANALLPWLRERLADGAGASARLAEAQLESAELQRASRSNGHGDIDERLREANATVSRELEVVRRVVREIGERGIEVRDLRSELLDFPGERNGRRVWLCWKADEPVVGYWHEVDTGFIGRQPL